MGAAHRHLDLELNYVLRGPMTYLIGGAVVTLPLRRLCALWGGMAHQTLGAAGSAEAFWVTAPLTTVLAWDLPEALMRRLLREGLAIDSQELGDERLLRCWVEDLQDGSEEGRQIVLLELEARLRRLAQHFESESAPASVAADNAAIGTGLQAVGLLARYVCDHYDEDIAVEQIAAAAHLHPNYAMTLFRQHTGMTLNGYLVLQRVAHAQRLLTTTDRSVSDIAHESGFGSTSRFYEAFRRQTGCAPRDFRRNVSKSLPG